MLFVRDDRNFDQKVGHLNSIYLQIRKLKQNRLFCYSFFPASYNNVKIQDRSTFPGSQMWLTGGVFSEPHLVSFQSFKHVMSRSIWTILTSKLIFHIWKRNYNIPKYSIPIKWYVLLPSHCSLCSFSRERFLHLPHV